MATISGIGLNGLGLNLASGVSSASGEPSVLAQAYGAWSTLDVFGTGGNVIRLRDASASPTERDFTATELTDGTYDSWAVSGEGSVFVTDVYDQSGSFTVSNGSSTSQPKYISSDNSILFDRTAPFSSPRRLLSANSDQINTDFGGNTIGDGVTFASSLRASSHSRTTKEAIFGVRDNAPASDLGDRHKFLIMNHTNDYIGVSSRDSSYTLFDSVSTDALSSSIYKNYVGVIFRNPVQPTTTTEFDLFVDGSQEIDTNTDTLSDACQVKYFNWGGGIYKSYLALAFDKILDASEVSTLNSEIGALSL